MWRALFLAVGFSVFVLGAECTVVEKAVLSIREEPANGLLSSTSLGSLAGTSGVEGPKRELIPPDWAPWTLMSAGAVVMLYSFTIPRRVSD